jgi:hypothetical protein
VVGVGVDHRPVLGFSEGEGSASFSNLWMMTPTKTPHQGRTKAAHARPYQSQQSAFPAVFDSEIDQIHSTANPKKKLNGKIKEKVKVLLTHRELSGN